MMSSAFLSWWKQNAPKGASNSINALLVICALRESSEPLSLKDLSRRLGLGLYTLNTLVTFLHEDGLLDVADRRNDTVRRNHYRVFSLSPHLADALHVSADLQLSNSPTLQHSPS